MLLLGLARMSQTIISLSMVRIPSFTRCVLCLSIGTTKIMTSKKLSNLWCALKLLATSCSTRNIWSPCLAKLIAVCRLASASSVLLRQKILRKCREDIYHFFNHENGQIAIYDAVNPLAAGRRSLSKEFAKNDIKVYAPLLTSCATLYSSLNYFCH